MRNLQLCGSAPIAYITDDSDVRYEGHDVTPDSDVLSSLSYWPTELRHKLLGIQSHFYPVVYESK